jgi:hypothetical protein
MVQRSDRREFFAPERLLAFSDGVFAVVITLLVLDLRLPETGHDDPAMLEALRSMVPKLLIFAFTFIIVGMGWLGHHRKFSYVHQIDSGLLWLNLIYLLNRLPGAIRVRRAERAQRAHRLRCICSRHGTDAAAVGGIVRVQPAATVPG